VVLQIGVHVVDQKLLFQLLLHLRNDAQVQVHPEGGDLAGLPVLPQPSWNVEQNSLELQKCR